MLMGTLLWTPVLSRIGFWTLIWTFYASGYPSRTEPASEHLIWMESRWIERSVKEQLKGPTGYEVTVWRLLLYSDL